MRYCGLIIWCVNQPSGHVVCYRLITPAMHARSREVPSISIFASKTQTGNPMYLMLQQKHFIMEFHCIHNKM